jgi:hypothetical protein
MNENPEACNEIWLASGPAPASATTAKSPRWGAESNALTTGIVVAVWALLPSHASTPTRGPACVS